MGVAFVSEGVRWEAVGMVRIIEGGKSWWGGGHQQEG